MRTRRLYFADVCSAFYFDITKSCVCVFINARGMSYYYNTVGGWFI